MIRSVPISVAVASLLVAQEPPTFQTAISEVHLDVGVFDQDGPVTGLTKKSFRVFDEGQEQTLTGFASEEQRLDIILLFDVSGSMHNQVANIASAAREAFHELRDGDRVAVMTFTSTASLIAPFSSDLDSVKRDIQAISSHQFRGNTQIREAIYEAADYFLKGPRSQRRRTILVITDNMGGHSRSEASVVTNLWEADAVLSGFVFPRPRPRGAPDDGHLNLIAKLFAGIDGIARKTGGEALRADDPRYAFAQMMQRIRRRYSLYYSAPEAEVGSFRSIRVELSTGVRPSGAIVRARSGYRVSGTR